MFGPLQSKLDESVPLVFIVNELDVVGNKAIIEITGEGKQKNGKPYNNK